MSSNFDPELRRILSKLTGHDIGDRDYVAYFANEYGEDLVFVRQRGKDHGVLLHSDLDWNPKVVASPSRPLRESHDLPSGLSQFLGDTPVVGDVILNHPEALWLKACLVASDGW